MRARVSSGGFTVLEILIFLTATTALFAIAFNAFNGQQQRTQFSQGVRDLEQKLRDVANDVATGYFPSNGKFRCNSGINGPTFHEAAGTEQGTNQDCIFVGRVIHFGRNSTKCTTTDKSECNEISIYSLAGNRQIGDIDAASIAESEPNAIDSVNAAGDEDVSVTEHYPTRYGANVTKVLIDRGGGVKEEIGAIGFMSNFDGSGGLTVSGSSTTEFYTFSDVPMGDTSANTVGKIQDGARIATNSGIANGVIVCLKSPYDNQNAAITFGANGSALATQSVFDEAAKELGCDD